MAFLLVVLVSMGSKVQKVRWLTQAIGIVVLITAFGLFFFAKAAELMGRPVNTGLFRPCARSANRHAPV